MTRFVGTPLTGVEFQNLGDEAFSARTVGDAHARLRIDAGGRITWSAGSSAGDVNLFRSDVNVLATDDIFFAPSGVLTLTTEGAPNQSLGDGAIAVDVDNDVLYFRSQSQWIKSNSSTVTISETEPASGREGDLWFDPAESVLYIFDTDVWVGVSSSETGSVTLEGLEDVTFSSLEDGQILKYSSSNDHWFNEFEIPHNVDGGDATSNFGGILAISGGGAAG